MKFFPFLVLPFGLSVAPFTFTKGASPLLKYFRFNLIQIACFLDDGLGTDNTFGKKLSS